MAFQAAYYTLYGRTESTYEPAMTKSFLHGRTEAIRTVQPESVKFTQIFCSEATLEEKVEALRVACKRHTDLTRECSKGLGQDRLLYALATIAKDPALGAEKALDNSQAMVEGQTHRRTSSSAGDVVMPAIFRDPGYATLGHSTLSTSNCGNPCLRLFGFGAVVPDGFGIGYIIKDDAISICASSKHLQTQRFLDTLRAYLHEIQRMLKQLQREATRKPNGIVSRKIGRVYAQGSPLDPACFDADASLRSAVTIYPQSPPAETAEESDLFGGYGFYESSFAALDKLLQESRKKKPSVGTKIAVLDY